MKISKHRGILNQNYQNFLKVELCINKCIMFSCLVDMKNSQIGNDIIIKFCIEVLYKKCGNFLDKPLLKKLEQKINEPSVSRIVYPKHIEINKNYYSRKG